MKIMLVAGEASGDFNGSHLAAELKEETLRWSFSAWAAS